MKDDSEDFHTLKAALDLLGFNRYEKETIFKMLAAVLHIGNIYFFYKKQVSAVALESSSH